MLRTAKAVEDETLPTRRRQNANKEVAEEKPKEPQEDRVRTRATAAPADGRAVRPPSGPPPWARCRRPPPRAPGAWPLPDRVGQRLQVVAAGAGRARTVGEPDDLPAARGGEALGVLGAQVVAVGFGVGRERSEYRGRVRVDVRQRRDGGTAASGARTATYRAHDVGRYRTLERAATTLHQVTPPCRGVSPRTTGARAAALTCEDPRGHSSHRC